MKDVFALGARNDRVPLQLLWVRFFALLGAGKIVVGVINDQQNSGPYVAAVVLDFLDVAQVHLAGGVRCGSGNSCRSHDVTTWPERFN